MSSMSDQSGPSGILILGRALHAPWNEGRRVIARDLVRVASSMRPVSAVSLTQEFYRGQTDASVPVEHVYTRVPYGLLGDYAGLPGVLRRARWLLSRGHITVVHLIGSPMVLAPWLRWRKLAVVVHVTLVNHVYVGHKERFRELLAGWFFDRWVTAYACTSPQIRDELLRRGYSAAKLHVVPPAIDLDLFRPQDRAAARRAVGMDQAAFIVVYVGTVSPLRFPADQIVEAFSRALSAIPHLMLEVFAPLATHPYNLAWADENVRRASGDAKFPVHVHLQDLTEEQKILVYSAADVVILPFTAPVAVEPPLTLLEAMACQAAVVVAPYANRSNIVEDGKNGFVYAVPEVLTDCLTHLHGCGTQGRAALGEVARTSILCSNSFEAVSSALREVWRASGMHDADA